MEPAGDRGHHHRATSAQRGYGALGAPAVLKQAWRGRAARAPIHRARAFTEVSAGVIALDGAGRDRAAGRHCADRVCLPGDYGRGQDLVAARRPGSAFGDRQLRHAGRRATPRRRVGGVLQRPRAGACRCWASHQRRNPSWCSPGRRHHRLVRPAGGSAPRWKDGGPSGSPTRSRILHDAHPAFGRRPRRSCGVRRRSPAWKTTSTAAPTPSYAQVGDLRRMVGEFSAFARMPSAEVHRAGRLRTDRAPGCSPSASPSPAIQVELRRTRCQKAVVLAGLACRLLAQALTSLHAEERGRGRSCRRGAARRKLGCAGPDRRAACQLDERGLYFEDRRRRQWNELARQGPTTLSTEPYVTTR